MSKKIIIVPVWDDKYCKTPDSRGLVPVTHTVFVGEITWKAAAGRGVIMHGDIPHWVHPHYALRSSLIS